MAAERLREKFQNEATCSVCRDFFTEPVILECGHSFCHTCIAERWAEPSLDATASCPDCQETGQQRRFKPNRQLAGLAEIAKQLSEQAEQEAAGGKLCERHQEPLKLFCEEDEAFLCLVCEKSRKHRDHSVIPMEEAVEEYKGQICACLENLRKQREEILVYQSNTEKESQDLLKQAETARQKAVAAFKEMRQFLEEKENYLLAAMEEADKEIVKKRDEHVARLAKELSSLDDTIQELEEKCQQVADELLGDIVSTLHRFDQKETFENPLVFPAALKWKIWEFSEFNPILEKNLAWLKGSTLKFEYQNQIRKETVTLDPDTAHPQLLISEDRKCVTLGDKPQDTITNYPRFVHHQCVLGKFRMPPNISFWEVDVGNEEGWAVGIAKMKPDMHNDKPLTPEEGIWAIGKWEGQYRVLIAPHNPPLSFKREPKRIRVFLNLYKGQVAFFDAETATLLYAFQQDHFWVVQPFFWLCKKSHLRLCP
ncbi:E3 ubiquitin-protein ligase TRIM7-like [Hemicordylus capensis]|uniref:E3 ubiquitin-protein ligase TRIM7-like n=1 Tax=Hemicordylus capensis TaxID=884348 RepID=UPI0023028FC3|nr:E3 ubiquitin-protein ligase TRIM7-like [Hemicordylus capensis]